MSKKDNLIQHRISQLMHDRIIPSSRYQFYQAFTFAGTAMLLAAILFYLQDENKTMLFFSYAVLLVELLCFCTYSLYAQMYDKEVNSRIKKNYELLLEGKK